MKSAESVQLIEEMVVVCGFQVIFGGGYDGGDYEKNGGFEVKTIKRKLLQLGGALKRDIFGF
ncbi:hypothetical protein M5K25_009438 [Dendrobium thyrsiflorum]|uniref:Uncharacterized protein n=1 Tax=Dendrobium thyrsiflorum TaxID=117978 RepID=A0ABD0V5S9_DENTH